MSRSGFWDNPERAQKIIRQRKSAAEPLEAYEEYLEQLEDMEIMLQLAEEDDDRSVVDDIRDELAGLRERVAQLQTALLLPGKYDSEDAIVQLHPGAGGLDAQDWVQMLLRMYDRWAERSGFSTETLDLLPGEEAGLKSATFSVRGENAYGLLKAEQGIHRLVRVSPFDSSGRRHTSFAAVDVMPDLPDAPEVEIQQEDLRIDTFRASGAGGQHVNTADSAVRITHEPTGIVATCQNERSQHKNRATAMKILRARLLQRRQQEREEQLQSLRGEQEDIAWGNQIRSYVFHPYNMVKDHRTDMETGNVEAVMDGQLDDFIRAYLEQAVNEDNQGRSASNS